MEKDRIEYELNKENMNQEDQLLIQSLEREIPVLTAQIRALYKELDQKYHLQGARIPISFGYDRDVLGSYTRGSHQEKEHFHFSLLFIGYSVAHPLSQSDRIDLLKHEYAHYMQYNMVIPEKYLWENGTHGSAWKYCCSLIGAVPSPYYKAGESLRKHDYEKKLKNPIHDQSVSIRDQYKREKEYKVQKNTIVKYKTGDIIQHPKYGTGTVEEVQKTATSVILKVRFQEECKSIDQGWLIRSQYQNKRFMKQ